MIEETKEFDLMIITFFSKRTMFKKDTSTGERLPLTFGSLTSKVLQTVLMIFGERKLLLDSSSHKKPAHTQKKEDTFWFWD